MPGPSDTASLPIDRDERLDQVLADYLRAAASGSAPDRTSLLSAYPDLADDLLSFFADQDRFRQVAAPLRAAVAPARPLPARVGPYDILGEIARGGMGVVLRARHHTLGRIVALKLLAAGSYASAADAARLRREAEAVAKLDHPNIVPIYEVGEHDGLPFFTMKLLDGSLAQLVRNQPLPPRDAAALVATIARAVHHAHQRGILHRDLKPANILLELQIALQFDLTHTQTPSSSSNLHSAICNLQSPLVADFGLARAADASALTSTGAIVGTPAYMAPEQARGDAGAVTVTSDVYGLGAILYECLTGRPPFKAATPVETLRLVIDHEPAPPRSLQPGIVADLDTIALKCLEKDPAKRYASAAELADDLDRFLASEPIRARPLGRAARFARAVLRQPVVAALVAALILVAVAGFALVFRQWQRAEANYAQAREDRDTAEQALKDAEVARQQAEVSFRQAHEAVNQFCVNVSDDLIDRPGMQELHRKLVQAARDYYREFVKQRGHDPTLRRELADTHVRVAQITQRIGQGREALATFREALVIYRELFREHPNDALVGRKLAGTLSNISILQDLHEGLKTSAESLELYRQLAAEHPDDLDIAAGMALVLSNRGSKFIGSGRFDDAGDALEEAARQQERLGRAYPWNDPLWSELAGTLDNLGVLRERQGARAESLCCYVRAHEIREHLARRRPNDPVRQANLAALRNHVGIALRNVGQEAAARAAFDSALSMRRQLAQANPRVTRYQVDYAMSLSNQAISFNRENKRDEALKSFHQSRQILERLLEKDPTSPGLRKLLGESWFNIAVTYGAKTQRVEEAEALLRARRLQEELLRTDADNVEHRHALGRTLNNLGINLWVRQHERESKEVLNEAIDSSSRLVKHAPNVVAYRRLLNAHHGLLAEIEWRQGHAEASVEQVRKRVALWDDDAAEIFNAGVELARAAALLGSDPASLPADKRRQQQKWIDEALGLLRRAVRLGYVNVKRMREDEDMALLRGRPEFDTLIGEMQADKSR